MALPTTKTDMCNLALSRIGAKAITTAQITADTDVRAGHCNRNYEQTRDALTRSHWWRFASTRIKLVAGWVTATVYTTDQYVSNDSVWYKCLEAHTSGALDDEPGTGAVEATYWTTLTAVDYTPAIGEYTYIWALPSDFLYMKSIYEGRFTDTNNYSYAIEGTDILTDESEVEIRYIKQVADVTEFDPLFVEVLILSLALKLVMPLSQDRALYKEIKEELYKEVMPKVRALNRQETNTIGRNDLGTWINARYTWER